MEKDEREREGGTEYVRERMRVRERERERAEGGLKRSSLEESTLAQILSPLPQPG